ncbi:hypothetical protein D3C72_566140 [compost metagenome]
MLYAQCALQKGDVIDVVWIPEKFARKGEVLGMKKDGLWDEGWQVVRVYGKVPVETVLVNRDALVHPWKLPSR